MYGENDVDCTDCHYGSTGQQTVVCCYYGELVQNECDPFGECSQFEPKEEAEEEFGCCMDDYIMPGLHYPSEYHNSAMLEAQ
jgi:hypothetical protein